MGPVMRLLPSASRRRVAARVACVAVLLALASTRALALQISNAAVAPGTVVPVGTVVTLTFTVTGNWHPLHNLKMIKTIEGAVCSQEFPLTPYSGYVRISATDPLVIASTPAGFPATSLDFGGSVGASFMVTCSFTATQSGTVNFSVRVYDGYGAGADEGCLTTPDTGCELAFDPDGIFDINTCSILSVPLTITSSLTGHAVLRRTSAGARPAGTVYVEDSLEVLMSATNTGSGPFNIQYAVSGTANTASTAGTVATGAPAFPIALGATPGPGNDTAMVWSYTVAANAGSGGVLQFRTSAEGVSAVTNIFTVDAAPLTITTTVFIDPDELGPLPKAPAANTWVFADDEVWVVATVTNASNLYDYTVDPIMTPSAGLVETVARTLPGPQPLGVSPASVSFTWRYKIDRSPGAAYQQCFHPDATRPPDMTWDIRVRGVSRTAALPVLRNSSSGTEPVTFIRQAPAVVDFGSTFTATIFVTNTSGATITLDGSATVWMEPDPAVGAKLAIVSGPVPSGSLSYTPGQTRAYLYEYQATAGGTQSLHGGIFYANAASQANPCIDLDLGNVQIVPPCPFTATLTTSKATVNSGELYTVSLAITNTTTCDSTLYASSIFLAQNPQLNTLVSPTFTVTGGCTGPGVFPCNLASGATATFVWWARPQALNSCGAQDWSGTMAGTWGGTCTAAGAFARPYTASPVTIRERGTLADPGSLGVSVTTATGVIEGGKVRVMLTVDPVGQNSVTSFMAAITVHTSTPDMVITPGLVPVPAFPFSLTGCGTCTNGSSCPAKRATFTWDYTAASKGTGAGFVWFTLTASGNDYFDGTPASASIVTTPVKVLRASTLWVDAEINPVPGTCMFDVDMTVQALGDTNVALTSIGIAAMSATSILPAGPVPAPAVVSPAGFTDFIWTYSPVGTGSTVNFTVSAVGTEIMLGGGRYAAADTTAAPEVITAPALSASAWLSRSLASNLPGQTVLLTLKVANIGTLPVAGPVSATAWLGGVPACGTAPASPPGLLASAAYDPAVGLDGCGNAQTFIWSWTLSTAGAGTLRFSASVTMGALSALAYTGCLTILPRPPLAVSILAAPAYALAGRAFSVTLLLENSGSTPLRVTPASALLATAYAGLTVQPPASLASFTVPAGSSITVLAVVKVAANVAAGDAQVSLVAAPFAVVDLTVGGTVASSVSTAGRTVKVLLLEPRYDLLANPFNPLAGSLPVHFVNPGGGAITIRAYNMAGEPVATILDDPAGPEEGVKIWNGKNAEGQVIAAGIYLIRFESGGLKVTKKLAVVK